MPADLGFDDAMVTSPSTAHRLQFVSAPIFGVGVKDKGLGVGLGLGLGIRVRVRV